MRITINSVFLTSNISAILTLTKAWVIKKKTLELKAYKMPFHLRVFIKYVNITYRKCLFQ